MNDTELRLALTELLKRWRIRNVELINEILELIKE
jgi:transcription termination factor NusB